MKRELRPLLAIVVMTVSLFVGSCSTTKLASVWRDQEYRGGVFTRVMVVGITDKPASRKMLEDGFVAQLKAHGIAAVPSYALVLSDKPDKDIVSKKAREQGIDTVLIARMIDQKTVEPYATLPPVMPPPVPYGPYYAPPGYYHGWNDLYGPNYPAYITQSSNLPFMVFKLETSLYDARQNRLIWSALTDTVTRGIFESELNSYIGTIMKTLKEERLVG